MPNYTFPERVIDRALGAYGLIRGSFAFPDASDNEFERSRDLAEATIWDAAAGLVNGGGSRKSMGNRSYTDMSIQTSQQDRQAWQNKANALRAKWGENAETLGVEITDFTYMW
ncbi:MAG: hypothetical protein RR459_03260 [Christensenellaceae bacterium]